MHGPAKDDKRNGKAVEAGDGDAGEKLPSAPDGGWGWMVVLGSFMIHVIADGIAYSFGVYVEDFIVHFGCSKSAVGGLGSLMIGVTWGAGPIASALTNKFGCRAVTIGGTLTAAFGFIISIFAPNVYFMYFSLGIVAGFGLGLAYLPAIVAVSFYFEKRRSLATGLAVCGSGLGTFIFAPLTQALLEEYTWKGTVLIEAGLLLNCILCGMVFRPLPQMNPANKPKTPTSSATKPSATDKVRDSAANADKPKLTSSLTVLPQGGDASSSFNEARRRTKSENWSAEPLQGAKSTQKTGPLSRKDVFYNQSLTHIPMYNEDPAAYVKSVTSVPGKSEKRSCWGKLGLSEEMQETISEMMDLSLLCDLIFVIFAISNFLTSVGYIVPYIFLPNRGLRLGFTEQESAWLISMVGISNTLGRIVFGFIADFKFVNRLFMYNTVLVLCGLTSLLSALCLTFAMQMLYSFCFGLFIGVYTCLTPIVLVDLLGLSKLSNSFGLVLLFQGIGAVVGPPFAGWLFDMSQSYDNSFYMMGICILVSGAMLYPIPCIQRWQNRKDSETDIALGKSRTSASAPVTSGEEVPLQVVTT